MKHEQSGCIAIATYRSGCTAIATYPNWYSVIDKRNLLN